MASTPPPHHHAVLFPFMSKGHIIPLLDLACLLLHSSVSVTIFTTPTNHHFIANSLSNLQEPASISIIDLPFPQNIDGVPPGIESTDQLPDNSLWLSLARAFKQMKIHFDQAITKLLPPVTFMVTDYFFEWTIQSAIEFNIPRFVYFGMSNFAMTVMSGTIESGIIRQIESADEFFPAPNFPWIKLTRNDFDETFRQHAPEGPLLDFTTDCFNSTNKSYGILVNSFFELEPLFSQHWNSHSTVKSISIGPFFLLTTPVPDISENDKKSYWAQWLDEKEEQGKLVIYVAFGSQAEISVEQFEQIKTGLERSEVNFLWVTGKIGAQMNNDDDGFEGRVKERGLVVKEWVDQRKILAHKSVQGFLSHCGWNSTIESICAEVPILAWPLMAEQPFNARMVAEEIKVGIMVETCNGSIRGFVKWETLQNNVRELMEGEKGKEVRKRVKQYGEAARRAMQEGGSSWTSLTELLKKLHATDKS